MNNSDFSSKLKKARTAKGLSQSQVSEQLYLSRSTYNHFESGIRTPSTDTLIRLSVIFNINPLELLIPLFPSEIKDSNKEYVNQITEYAKENAPNNILSKLNNLNHSEQALVNNLIDTLINSHTEIS